LARWSLLLLLLLLEMRCAWRPVATLLWLVLWVLRTLLRLLLPLLWWRGRRYGWAPTNESKRVDVLLLLLPLLLWSTAVAVLSTRAQWGAVGRQQGGCGCGSSDCKQRTPLPPTW
jgi:hypothetical protein